MRRLVPLIVVCAVLGAAPANDADRNFAYVDLKPHANQKLTDPFGSGREGNDLAGLPTGEQTFAGVKFKVGEGVVQLGSKLLKEERPDKVEGIKVGRKFVKLHILHATGYGNGSTIGEEGKEGDPLFVADGARIAEYVVRYEDKSAEVIPVVYGEDVRDWWYTDTSKGVKRGKVAWKGDNELGKSFGSKVRLYLSTWENPKPEKVVVGIDYAKAGDTPAAPFCVAITAESK
jgi:hypothetical protein